MGLFKFLRAVKRPDDTAPKVMPTVRSTTTSLSARVQEDVRLKIKEISAIDESDQDSVLEAALRSIIAGRDLYSLSKAIRERCGDGMTQKRAGEISRSIHNVASATLQAERQISLDIETAIWRYSGAPCMTNPRSPTASDLQQDKAHKVANGKTYEVSKGMFLNGVWTLPGREEGCKCSSKSIIPWIDQ